MSALTDMFMDPLVSKAPSLAIAYRDEYNLWEIFEGGFFQRLPLTKTEWSPPSLPTTYVIPEMGCTALPDDHPAFTVPNSPVHWYRKPYLHLYFVRIEPADTSTYTTITVGGKSSKVTVADAIKQRVRAWCEAMMADGNEWLVIYMPMRTGKETRSIVDTFRAFTGAAQYNNTSLGMSFYSSMFSSIRTECSSRRATARFVRLDHFELYQRQRSIAESRLTAAENRENNTLKRLDAETMEELERQWKEFLSHLHVAVYESLTARVRAHDEELSRLHEQRYQPNWNFTHYFCVKESLAFVFAQVRLPQETLRCYEELAATFQLVSTVPDRSVRTTVASALEKTHSFASTTSSIGRAQGSVGSAASIGGRAKMTRADARAIFSYSATLQDIMNSMRTSRGISDRGMLEKYPIDVVVTAVESATRSITRSARDRGTLDSSTPSMSTTSLRGSPTVAEPSSQIANISMFLENRNDVSGLVSLRCPPPHLLDLSTMPYRQLIYNSEISLPDFHHYLFARQCMVLQMLKRDIEIADRAVQFIKLMTNISTAHIIIGRAQAAPVAAWLFRASMDLVETCTRKKVKPEYHPHARTHSHRVSLRAGSRKSLVSASAPLTTVVEKPNSATPPPPPPRMHTLADAPPPAARSRVTEDSRVVSAISTLATSNQSAEPQLEAVGAPSNSADGDSIARGAGVLSKAPEPGRRGVRHHSLHGGIKEAVEDDSDAEGETALDAGTHAIGVHADDNFSDTSEDSDVEMSAGVLGAHIRQRSYTIQEPDLHDDTFAVPKSELTTEELSNVTTVASLASAIGADMPADTGQHAPSTDATLVRQSPSHAISLSPPPDPTASAGTPSHTRPSSPMTTEAAPQQAPPSQKEQLLPRSSFSELQSPPSMPVKQSATLPRRTTFARFKTGLVPADNVNMSFRLAFLLSTARNQFIIVAQHCLRHDVNSYPDLTTVHAIAAIPAEPESPGTSFGISYSASKLQTKNPDNDLHSAMHPRGRASSMGLPAHKFSITSAYSPFELAHSEHVSTTLARHLHQNVASGAPQMQAAHSASSLSLATALASAIEADRLYAAVTCLAAYHMEKIGHSHEALIMHIERANVLVRHREFSTALPLLNDHLPVVRKQQWMALEAWILLLLCACHLGLGHHSDFVKVAVELLDSRFLHSLGAWAGMNRARLSKLEASAMSELDTEGLSTRAIPTIPSAVTDAFPHIIPFLEQVSLAMDPPGTNADGDASEPVKRFLAVLWSPQWDNAPSVAGTAHGIIKRIQSGCLHAFITDKMLTCARKILPANVSHATGEGFIGSPLTVRLPMRPLLSSCVSIVGHAPDGSDYARFFRESEWSASEVKDLFEPKPVVERQLMNVEISIMSQLAVPLAVDSIEVLLTVCSPSDEQEPHRGVTTTAGSVDGIELAVDPNFWIPVGSARSQSPACCQYARGLDAECSPVSNVWGRTHNGQPAAHSTTLPHSASEDLRQSVSFDTNSSQASSAWVEPTPSVDETGQSVLLSTLKHLTKASAPPLNNADEHYNGTRSTTASHPAYMTPPIDRSRSEQGHTSHHTLHHPLHIQRSADDARVEVPSKAGFCLTPGFNTFVLTTVAPKAGTYKVAHVRALIGGRGLILTDTTPFCMSGYQLQQAVAMSSVACTAALYRQHWNHTRKEDFERHSLSKRRTADGISCDRVDYAGERTFPFHTIPASQAFIKTDADPRNSNATTFKPYAGEETGVNPGSEAGMFYECKQHITDAPPKWAQTMRGWSQLWDAPDKGAATEKLWFVDALDTVAPSNALISQCSLATFLDGDDGSTQQVEPKHVRVDARLARNCDKCLMFPAGNTAQPIELTDASIPHEQEINLATGDVTRFLSLVDAFVFTEIDRIFGSTFQIQERRSPMHAWIRFQHSRALPACPQKVRQQVPDFMSVALQSIAGVDAPLQHRLGPHCLPILSGSRSYISLLLAPSSGAHAVLTSPMTASLHLPSGSRICGEPVCWLLTGEHVASHIYSDEEASLFESAHGAYAAIQAEYTRQLTQAGSADPAMHIIRAAAAISPPVQVKPAFQLLEGGATIELTFSDIPKSRYVHCIIPVIVRPPKKNAREAAPKSVDELASALMSTGYVSSTNACYSVRHIEPTPAAHDEYEIIYKKPILTTLPPPLLAPFDDAPLLHPPLSHIFAVGVEVSTEAMAPSMTYLKDCMKAESVTKTLFIDPLNTRDLARMDRRTKYVISDKSIPLPLYHSFIVQARVMPNSHVNVPRPYRSAPPGSFEMYIPHPNGTIGARKLHVDATLHGTSVACTSGRYRLRYLDGATMQESEATTSSSPAAKEESLGGVYGNDDEDSAEDADEDGPDSDEVHVQVVAVSFVPRPLRLKMYNMSAPATSGWSITADCTRTILNRSFMPHAAVRSRASIGEDLVTNPRLVSYALAFAYRFKRSISASNAITARFSLEYEMAECAGEERIPSTLEGTASRLQGLMVGASHKEIFTFAEDIMLVAATDS